MSLSSDINIRTVFTKQDLRDFVEVPNRLYADDPHYRVQLMMERLEHLDVKKNPYFKHATHQFFIAYQNDEPVGRISAQIDDLAQKDKTPRLGHFGFVDARDASILQALLDKAEDWLRQQKVKTITGPYSLSINDEAGLLVEGFDSAPYMMMNYAPHWVGDALEAHGYRQAKDLLAFHMRTNQDIPAAGRRIANKAAEHPEVSLRTLDKKHMKRDLDIVLKIFNEAWAENWGFVQMTADEIAYTARSMKPLIQPDLVWIAEIENEPTAMIVALPNLNEALDGLGGRLFPFGWLKLLWRLKVKKMKTARILLMGVRKDQHNGFLGGALAVTVMERLHASLYANGYKDTELSWVLDDNAPMIRLIKGSGARFSKRYRIYQKDLI